GFTNLYRVTQASDIITSIRSSFRIKIDNLLKNFVIIVNIVVFADITIICYKWPKKLTLGILSYKLIDQYL
ncbi:MAG: hypothetical protein AAF462_11130, partial [Thermodesulfobacteriota bacterium]